MSALLDLIFTFSTVSLYRRTLKLVDKNGDLVFLVIPHGHEVLKEKLSILMKEIEALFPGELKHTDSRAPGYQFLALHYSYYNRYHESVSKLLAPLQHLRLTWVAGKWGTSWNSP